MGGQLNLFLEDNIEYLRAEGWLSAIPDCSTFAAFYFGWSNKIGINQRQRQVCRKTKRTQQRVVLLTDTDAWQP